MLGMGTSDVIVRTTTFVQVGKYNAMPPGFVKLPKARAANWLATGQAAAVDVVPDGAQIVTYSEADFSWTPNANAKPPAPDLTIPDLLKRWNWKQADFETAQLCGFPKADRTTTSITPGAWDNQRTLKWSADSIETWERRIRSLKIR